MNRLLLKAKFKTLVKRCGGLDEAVEACREAAERGEGRTYSRAQLDRCGNPSAPDFAPLDVVAVLEAFCGEPIVSRAMAEARPSAFDGADIREEASEATEAVAALQRAIRLAYGDGHLSPAEARAILAMIEEAMGELRDVAGALGLIISGGGK